MADVLRVRRYYLLKRLEARASDSDLELTWQAKQEAEAGTLLPADFPSKATLEAVGYTTVEDVDGADRAELAEYASLRPYEADAVIAAAASLI